MWADTLAALERGHLLRLALWGGGSLMLGAMILVFLTWRRTSAPLLWHFAVQTALWGTVDVAISAWGWRGLALRDYAGAQQLLNFLWLNTGLNAGYAMLGVTLAVASWRMGPRPAGIGAGVGIMLQGLAILLLDMRLIANIGPMQ